MVRRPRHILTRGVLPTDEEVRIVTPAVPQRIAVDDEIVAAGEAFTRY